MTETLIDREYNKFSLVSPEETAVRTIQANALVPEVYDKVLLGYSGSYITSVEYYNKGALQATLNIGYSDGKIVSVEKISPTNLEEDNT